MSDKGKQANPDRHRDNARVFNKDHGWGRTFNPRVGSYFVDVNFGNEKIVSLHEDEIFWPITYNDRCVAFGSRLTDHGGLTWFYSPNAELEGESPRDAIDDGRLNIVEEIFDQTFGL